MTNRVGFVALTPMQPTTANVKSAFVAYLLWFLVGPFGFQKFYVGKVGWGFLYLFTFGLFGFGWLIDLFTIPTQVRNYNRGLHDGGCWA